MTTDLSGKKILIVEGSLVSVPELRSALVEAGARVCVARTIESAFNLVGRIRFDAAVVDQALHNMAFDLCTEFQAFDIPYIHCNAPNRLQGLSARESDAQRVVCKLAHVMSCIQIDDAEYIRAAHSARELRTI
jgi:DNA-binding response OmpR family regulator